MLIICPNCATSYQIEPSSLGAAGRSVRCVRCRTIWFVRDPEALSAITRDFRAELGVPAPAEDHFAEPALSAAASGEAPEGFPPAAEGFDGEDVVAAPAPGMDDPALLQVPQPPPEWSDHQLPILRESVLLTDPPPLATSEHDGAAGPAGATPAEDIETFAARRLRLRAAKHRFHWPLPGLPTAILALVALNAGLIGWRADIVRFLPQTASLYAAIGLPVNLRGLAFANVAIATETHDGVPVLVVEGTIVSTRDRAVEVPRLRFSIRNQRGQEVYAWTALPSRSVLAPGETLPFRSRLASPPPETRDVLVRFFSRRDRVASIQ
jgi:predicted Zn finger-like uncharacterized protein